MSGYEPGDLVELWEQGDLVSAVILGHDKGRLRAVTESGDIVRVTASRIAHRAGRAAPGEASGAKAAASHAREARERAGTVDVAALWEILVDAGGRHAPADLASLALGGSDASDTSAIIRCLSAEKVYFVRKGDDWVARSRSAVEETLRRIRTETERERRRNAFLERLRRRLSTPGGGEDLEEADHVYLGKIIDLAVMGDESVTRKEAVALLSDLGAGGPIAWLAAFDLLVRLGIFTEDENLEIRRFGLRTRFPEDVLAEAEEASKAPVPEQRRDLTGLTLFTVDDPDTSEVDDALSWEEMEDGGGIAGVHISDPTAFVRPGGRVEAEALARAATYYFPDRRLTMLPPVISEDAASLVEDEDRPAVSFMIHLGPDADVRKFEIFPSTVRVSRRLSYEEADVLLDLPGGGDTSVGRALAEIDGAARRLQARRVETGAILLRAPEVSVRVDSSGAIRIKRTNERGSSRELVAELMIQVNALCAGFCATNGIPAIYRRQPPPETAPPEVPDGPYDPVAMRAARRGLRRGEIGLEPDVHYALGVPAYMQVTSPLRRFQDFTAIRQVKAWLAGQPLPGDAEALGRIAATTEAVERSARQAESSATSYWILRHYAGRLGDVVEAAVIHVEPRKTIVEIDETLTVTSIAARPDHAPGQRLRLEIVEVRPRLGSIRLRQIDTGAPA